MLVFGDSGHRHHLFKARTERPDVFGLTRRVVVLGAACYLTLFSLVDDFPPALDQSHPATQLTSVVGDFVGGLLVLAPLIVVCKPIRVLVRLRASADGPVYLVCYRRPEQVPEHTNLSFETLSEIDGHRLGEWRLTILTH